MDVPETIKSAPTSRDIMDQLLDKLLVDENSGNNNGASSTIGNVSLGGEIHDSMGPASYDEIKRAFDNWELKRNRSDEQEEFATIEAFILEEQNRGIERRKKARVLQASEEVKMASEIAQLKGFRLKRDREFSEADLQNKISDKEHSYLRRKAVVAKAAQLATNDCRAQFTRVRAFFESLHRSRKESLLLSYERSLKMMAITHRLRETDSRVAALEQQSAERMYRKKEANLNELHMAQNLEEAAYMESMFELLDKVQTAKEEAATALFHLQVEDLKSKKESQTRREKELQDLAAESTLEMAKLVAHYVEEQGQYNEDDNKHLDKVSATERKKHFYSHPSNAIGSVSDLYDTIIWSVATSQLGLSTTGSSIYTESVHDNGSEEEEEHQGGEKHSTYPDLDESDPQYLMGSDAKMSDVPEDFYSGKKNDGSLNGSFNSGSTANTSGSEEGDLSVLGKMHVVQIKKDLKMKEKSLLKKHSAEMKQERHQYRKATQELKLKQQRKIEMLLRQCVGERHRLREKITQRMTALAANQELSTKTLQESIDQDVKAMRDAWAEHKRLEDAEKTSFDKAQALISAQVFHEVRNALSSVIAMSEMTSTLQEDSNVTPSGLVASVNEMLDQNEEVVRYSLTMLNNILDINKIKTGSFRINKKAFDLTELLQRATKMQLIKAQARGVNMSFETPAERCIAFTDQDIVLRIVTNFISNAVKFTSSGAIQPFILPVDKIMPSVTDPRRIMELDGNLSQGHRMKLVAVGVADTGCGLTQKMLNKAEAGLYNSDSQGTSSGAKNSGFGLHLAHQLAGTLGTRIHLANLAHCHNVLNKDISASFKHHESNIQVAKRSDFGSDATYGTVLFVVVPVLEDGDYGHLSRRLPKEFGAASHADNNGNDVFLSKLPRYKFHPQPSTRSTANCFRVMIADDVLMLRKGLVRSVLQVFDAVNCPVSVHTACTAEDALRLISSQQFDIVISDNQFAPPATLKLLETNDMRPYVLHDGESNMQQSMSNFFRSESFTIEEGDGDLSGLQALLQLLENAPQGGQTHPLPILILLSGHKFDLAPDCGVIIAQKPLRTREIVTLLEAHAECLVEAGSCFEEEDGSGEKCRIVNRRGSQIFCREIVS